MNPQSGIVQEETGSELVDRAQGLDFSTSVQFSAEAITLFQEGLALLECGEPKAAVVALSQSVQCAPEFTGAHICLGLAHAMACNIYPALDHLELAAELEPHSFTANYLLAQLNFKLRIPKKGYARAAQALEHVCTREQRKMIAALLREERAREHSGIARPWFNQPWTNRKWFGRIWHLLSGAHPPTAAPLLSPCPDELEA